MADKRSEARVSIKIEVELYHEGDTFSCHTRDLSHTGVFLESDFVKSLEIGLDVSLRIKNDFAGEQAPVVTAKVVRIEPEGFALKFEAD